MNQVLFNILSRYKVSPNQYCVLWHCKNNLRCTIVSNLDGEARILQLHGFLDMDNKLQPIAEELLANVEALFRKTKPTGPDVLGDGYGEQIIAYRDKFPVGKKATPNEVLNKFIRFFTTYPDTTWGMVQKATDLYIAEKNQFHYKAGNFITVKRDEVDTWPLYEYMEKVQLGCKAEPINAAPTPYNL